VTVSTLRADLRKAILIYPTHNATHNKVADYSGSEQI